MEYKITNPDKFKLGELNELRLRDPIATAYRQQIAAFQSEIDKLIYEELLKETKFVLISDVERLEIPGVYEFKFTINYMPSNSVPDGFTGQIINLEEMRSNLYQSNIDYKNMSFEELKRIILKVFK